MKSIGLKLERLRDEEASFLVAAGLHLPFLTNDKYYGYRIEKPQRQKTYQSDSAFSGGRLKRTYQSDSAFSGGGGVSSTVFCAGGGCGGCGGC